MNGAKKGTKISKGGNLLQNKLKIFWNVIYHKSNINTQIYYVDIKKTVPQSQHLKICMEKFKCI